MKCKTQNEELAGWQGSQQRHVVAYALLGWGAEGWKVPQVSLCILNKWKKLNKHKYPEPQNSRSGSIMFVQCQEKGKGELSICSVIECLPSMEDLGWILTAERERGGWGREKKEMAKRSKPQMPTRRKKGGKFNF